jgi:hypothetical protein
MLQPISDTKEKGSEYVEAANVMKERLKELQPVS